MKIVQSDNFGMSGEIYGRDEKFLLWAMSEQDCKAICEILNKQDGDFSTHFY